MTPRKEHSEIDGPLAVRELPRPQASILRREIDRLTARVAELEQETAALKAFAANAAHELMVPLVMTEAYAGMVAERLEPGQEDSRGDLETISRAAARTRILVEAILRDATAHDRAPELERVDLSETVRQCLDLLGPEIAARGADVRVNDLPVVSAEPAPLGAVFMNLIANALKYGPRQEPRILIGCDRDDAYWRCWVESYGPALAPEERERIFGPFNRGRGERRAPGSGLGLAICKRIVERHGGTIGVVPANGSGNRFSFTLPAR